MRVVFIYTILMLYAIQNYARGADLPMVLPPIVSSGEEVAFLIVPGAYINAAFYEPLGRALQNATSLRLWVGLVGPFVADLPSVNQCSKDIETTLSMMQDMGMNTDVIFLSGHSLGGVVMQSWGWQNSSQVSGMVLLASELMLDSLEECTAPVMQISGDLDGMETIAKKAPAFKELEGIVDIDPINKVMFPVVLLQDVNHMYFASGEPPSNVKPYDILSPITEDEAHALIATHIMAFVTAASGLPALDVPTANAILIEDFDNTAAILNPLFEMNSLTDAVTYSPWSENGQIIISSIDASFQDVLQVNDTFLAMAAFENSRPSIEINGEQAMINTYTHLSYSGLLDVNGPISAEELAVKFKSREALMEVLTPMGIPFNGETSCMLINEAGLDTALQAATEVQRERYSARGKPIILEIDDVKITGEAWVSNDIQYNATDDSLLVTSVALHTNVDAGFGLGGMHYCKLMPPSRMIEYISIFSLRGTQP